MSSFFTSDLHFFHKNILTFMPERGRVYKNVYDMNEKIIEKWNSQVKSPETRVYVLGDVSFGDEFETKKVMAELNGQIYLVEGNHDFEESNKYHRPGFCYKNLEMDLPNFKVLPRVSSCRVHGHRAILCHFPFMDGEADHNPNPGKKPTLMLHGHLHQSRGFRTGKYMLDVGWDYKHGLISEREIALELGLIKSKQDS